MYVHTSPLLSRVMRGRLETPTARPLLLVAPTGSGKTTAALALAAETGCEADYAPFRSGVAAEACGCPSCAGLATSPDVLRIRGDAPIADVRNQVMPFVSSAPKIRDARWLVIEHGQLLRKASADTLLRTMESPPEWLRVVVVASNAESLPSAIRSRCQEYRVDSPTTPAIAEIVRGTPALQAAASSLAAFPWTSIRQPVLHSRAHLDRAFKQLCVDRMSPAEVQEIVRDVWRLCGEDTEFPAAEARAFAVRFILRRYIQFLELNRDNDPASKDAQLVFLNAMVQGPAAPALAALEHGVGAHLMNVENQIVALFTAILIARSRAGA